MSVWNTPGQALPAIGESVQFIVTGHRAWLSGTYAGEGFRSRWAAYATSDVVFWRSLADELRVLAGAMPVPDQRYWSEQSLRGA